MATATAPAASGTVKKERRASLARVIANQVPTVAFIDLAASMVGKLRTAYDSGNAKAYRTAVSELAGMAALLKERADELGA